MYMLGLLAVLGMAGFALDLGLAYLTMTRVQNAVDAAALAGAQTLFTLNSTGDATARANAVYAANATQLPTATPTVEFSPTQSPFSPSLLDPRYVRVTATVPSNTYLSQVFGAAGTIAVAGTAVAGPMPFANACAKPLGICGSAASGDSDCTDGNGCYGLPATEITAHDGPISSGNYGLLDIGSGASSVAESLAGASGTCATIGQTANTQPGAANTIVNALNSRFGTASGVYNDPAAYPPDLVTTEPLLYPAYQAALATGIYTNPGGRAKRRALLIPILDCSQPMVGASKPVTVLGQACMFLTRAVPSSGPTVGEVYLQVIDSCPAEGGVPGGVNASGASRTYLFTAGTDS
jgi:hypothetical protein